MYGSSQAASCLYDIVFIVCFQLHAPVQVLLDVKSVFLIIIRRVLVVRVLCKVILIGKEWSHPSKLQDTLAAIHDSNFVSRQQVFSYPPEISDVDEALFEAEGLDRDERGARVALIYPYGYHSYGEYFAHLQGFVDKYEETAPELADSIRQLIESIKRMNVKEDWSVVRYVGHEYDDKPRVFGLTMSDVA